MLRTDRKSLLKGYRKAVFYIGNFIAYAVPDTLYRSFFRLGMRGLTVEQKDIAASRAAYYVRCGNSPIGDAAGTPVKDFRYPFGQKHKFSAYFFDLYQYARLFGGDMRFLYLFGDVDWNLAAPTIVKARPIGPGLTGNVLFKLNKLRHFSFVRDTRPFSAKKDMIVFRNEVRKQPQRTRFMEMFIDNPMCDVGRINDDVDDGHPEYVKPYMPIEEQLGYKFVACIEGHDVATNLKWVMSSNSIAVMPRPRIESWFMEGTLVGGVHYIEVKDDYSDLEDKLRWYISHPDEAESVISNAHDYVRRFCDRKLERYTCSLVLDRYFSLTGQKGNVHGKQ